MELVYRTNIILPLRENRYVNLSIVAIFGSKSDNDGFFLAPRYLTLPKLCNTTAL